MRRSSLTVELLLALAAVGVLASCDKIPTDPPNWTTTWQAPGDSTFLSVDHLLPRSVMVAPGGAAFQLSLEPNSSSQTLGEMCGAGCSSFDGQASAKPAFQTHLTTVVDLPEDVESATLAGGMVDITLIHTFGFDPFRPGGAARGGATIAVTSGSRVLAIRSIDRAFPANTPLTERIALDAGLLDGPLSVTVSLSSPEGDPVTSESSDRLTVTVTPIEVRVAEAEIALGEKLVEADSAELDLSEVEESLRWRVRGGAILVSIVNPFDVEAEEITLNLGPLAKPLRLSAGTTTQRVELTKTEIQATLGQKIPVFIHGTVTPSAGTLTIRPGQALVIRSRLELTLGEKK